MNSHKLGGSELKRMNASNQARVSLALAGLVIIARLVLPGVCPPGWIGSSCPDGFDPPPCTCPELCPPGSGRPGSGGQGGGGAGGGGAGCSACFGAQGGMPSWWVSEPFINL